MAWVAGSPNPNVPVVGAAGDPDHRHVCRAHAPARGHLAYAECDLAIDVVAVVFLVDVVRRPRGTGVAREEPAREGTEGRDGDALVPAVGEDVWLSLAVEQ